MSATVYEKFCETARAHPDRPFLNVIPTTAKAYNIDAGEISYNALFSRVEKRKERYAEKKYSKGRRVGLLLENRPVFFEIFLHVRRVDVGKGHNRNISIKACPSARSAAFAEIVLSEKLFAKRRGKEKKRRSFFFFCFMASQKRTGKADEF